MAEARGLPNGLDRSRAPLICPELYPPRGPWTSSKTSPAATAGVICPVPPPHSLPNHENTMLSTSENVPSDALYMLEPRAAGPAVNKPQVIASIRPAHHDRLATGGRRPRPRPSKAGASSGTCPTRPARRAGSHHPSSAPITSRRSAVCLGDLLAWIRLP